MNHHHLQKLSPNLIFALHALLTEKHVTRAGAKLFLSQSACSNLLRQLREHLNDQLLVRTANGYDLTPRAKELLPRVETIIQHIDNLFSGASDFYPQKSQRTFVLGLSDYSALCILPKISARLSKEAPNVKIIVKYVSMHMNPKLFDEDEIDLGIGILSTNSPQLSSEPLYSDHGVLVIHPKNPLARKNITIAQYVSAPHIATTCRGQPLGSVDTALEKLGLERNIILSVPYALPAFQIIHDNPQYFFTTAMQVAKRKASHFGLLIKPLPFKVDEIVIKKIWHRKYDQDPAHQWLRGLIQRDMRLKAG